MKRSPHTVRSYLAAIAAAVIAVYVLLGAVAAFTTLRSGEGEQRDRARYRAAMAAEGIARSLEAAQTQAQSVAANPNVPAILAAPKDCQLSFDLQLFPGSRLDVVGRDGHVVCSSAPPSFVTSHVGAAWLDEISSTKRPVATGTFSDASTGPSVAYAFPVLGSNGALSGTAVSVLPVAVTADLLADAYAGPAPFQFALVDTDANAVVSSSDLALRNGLERHIEKGSALGASGFLIGSQAVTGSGWRVVSAIRTDDALASTWEVLARGLLIGAAMLIVLLIGLVVVSRRIVRPLRQLNGAVSQAGPGATHQLRSIRGPREIEQVAKEFDAALTEHANYEAQLSHQALHDPLTGLPNRALLADRLEHAIRQSQRTGRGVCVLFLDLDHFKLINDGLGHAMGDIVLTETAERLSTVVRDGDTVARFGGDEFVIIGEAMDDHEAEHLAQRLLAVLGEPIQVGDHVVRVTASAGIAIGTASSSPDSLLRDADAAMYLAKDRGRARSELFNEDLRGRASSRLAIETELRAALERHELHLAFQPKVELATGTIIGAEALLRWTHPRFGSVSPDTFIPIAEDTGLIIPIGRFVLEETARQAAAWAAEGFVLDVAANVSARQLADPGFVETVRTAIDTYGLDPSRLTLELTESVLMGDTLRTADSLRAVHRVGVQISVDDFGTGYSSLSYLQRFPVDELKIDRSFITNLAAAPQQQSLVKAMIAMAEALTLRTVAEGVETQQQADLLQDLGCDLAQGYLYARPQPAKEITDLLTRAAVIS